MGRVTHSLNEDFPDAHAAADLPQALFHRLRIRVVSNNNDIVVEGGDKDAPLPRAKWIRRRSFPQSPPLRTPPPTRGQCTDR